MLLNEIQMIDYKIIFTTGIAMFAMFFGSGNLVFPLELGVLSGDKYLVSSFGFIITGVLVPFLGLFSVMLYEGDRHKYFSPLGEKPAFILTIIMLSLMGPFGVLPRCILVAFGAFKAIYPAFPLILFSLFFSFVVVVVVWKENNFVPIIGRILGPMKITVILFIIFASLIFAPTSMVHYAEFKPFYTGILEGYQTMDLPASFFFSVTIMAYLNKVVKNKEDILKLGIYSSLVGGGLIAIIYFLFTNLGAHYANYLSDSNPEEYLAAITEVALGRSAAFVFAIMMFFACLTTASTLCKLFAELLYKDVSNGKLGWHKSVMITITISFILSLTGFSAISSFLKVILVHIYPALIVFTIASIYNKYRPFPYIKHLFWATFAYEVIIQNF
jgi:branched-chain amino acid:cation transporter, LIVCS family